nr:restriction endonuclease subunit S [Tenacibaculum mesophilum]
MNKEEKILPVLRFPEFVNDSEWENKQLDSLCKFVRGPFGGALKKEIFVKEGYAVYEQSQAIYNQFNVFRYFITKEKFEELKRFAVNKDDIIMSCSGTMGKFSIVPKKFKKGVINQALLKLTVKENLVVPFIKISLELPLNQNKLLAQSAGGAIKNVVGVNELKKIEIPIPHIKEQEKIANCLSSLDNLITEESEKLDLLKDHKKGLLQQLFPAKGETKPQYRFQEFKNDGDWEETILDDVADYANGKAHEKEISETGKYKVVNSKFISTDGRVVKFTDSTNLKANIGDILMVLSDIPNGKAIAKCFYVDKEDTYTVNQRICKITPTGIDNKFLFYIQNRNSYFLAFDDGVKQTNLRKDTVLSFPFLKPKSTKEQQKIANCLSSTDDLIQAQKTKIKNLKNHKKGLMQKLFPNVNNKV